MKYSMKVVNDTDYDTIEIRKIFTKVLNYDEKVEGEIGRNLYIHLKYSRSMWVSGRAWMNTGSVEMFLPKLTVEYGLRPGIFSLEQDIAFVFMHELQHCRGYRHRKINDTNLKRLAVKTIGGVKC